MARVKIQLEYVLNTTSEDTVWENIGTAAGLEEWFADKVVFDGRNIWFSWEGDEDREAEITSLRPLSVIKFKWCDSPNRREFVELRLIEGELTEDLVLRVTDFCEENEEADTKYLWNTQIDCLRRFAGF